MRRSMVVLIGTALATFMLAGTAFATHVKVIDFSLDHQGQGQDRKLVLSGKVVPVENDPPPGGENCGKETGVVAQRYQNGHWVTRETGQSNANGRVEIKTEDRKGKWRLLVPEHLSGEKQCFEGKSRFKRHRHPQN